MKRAIAFAQKDRYGAAHLPPLGDREIKDPVLIEVRSHHGRGRVAIFVLGFLNECTIAATQQDHEFVVSERNGKVRPPILIKIRAGECDRGFDRGIRVGLGELPASIS